MNPFGWTGPAFLGFYLLFAAAVLVLLFARVRSGDPSRARLETMTADPYRIALLRGGEAEALRVAIFNLVDRKLLEDGEGTVRAARDDATQMVRRPLDVAILKACRNAVPVRTLLRDQLLLATARDYERGLQREGLLADDETFRARMRLLLIAAGLLAGVSVVKIVVAVSRGRTNVELLVLLTAVACFAAYRICRARHTAAGIEVLKSLRGLTGRLSRRSDTVKPGGATNEALLLASVHGLEVLRNGPFPAIDRLFPKPRSSGSDSSGGDSGSSCGSSCGGGGGCGGCGSD